MNPIYNNDWYENIKKLYGENLNSFYCEIDLKNISPIKNKDRIINVRLDDETMNKLSTKLIEMDLSLSEYIRTLIKKDI